MKRCQSLLAAASIALALFWPAGCAYRHYLGLHGPSIQAYPAIHEGVSEDQECLACHHPERDPTGPPTNHPRFRGCLKCHDDDIGRSAS